MKKKLIASLLTCGIVIQLILPINIVFADEVNLNSIKKENSNTNNINTKLKNIKNNIIKESIEKYNLKNKKSLNLFRIPWLEKGIADIIFKNVFIGNVSNYEKENEKKEWNKNFNDKIKSERYLQTTSLDNKKKIKLHAYYIDNGSNTTVLIQHGYTSNAMVLRNEAKMFLNEGFNVLLPDARSSGLSEGKYITFGNYEKNDINKWINEEENLHPNQNIILYGQSMGAATVLLSQGRNPNKNVKAIIEDCGYANLRQEFKDIVDGVISGLENSTGWLIDWNGFKNNILNELNSNYLEPKLKFNLNTVNPINSVSENTIPKLFIHGTSDSIVPFYNEQNLFNAAKGYKEKLIVKGANHVESFNIDTKKYEDTINKFLNKSFIPNYLFKIRNLHFSNK